MGRIKTIARRSFLVGSAAVVGGVAVGEGRGAVARHRLPLQPGDEVQTRGVERRRLASGGIGYRVRRFKNFDPLTIDAVPVPSYHQPFQWSIWAVAFPENLNRPSHRSSSLACAEDYGASRW